MHFIDLLFMDNQAPEVQSTRSRDLRTFMSVHLTLPHEFRGRSDRECQDLRLGRLGVPRPAKIAARLTLATRADLVSSRNLPADQTDHSPLISPVCGSGSLRDARDLPGELTDKTGVQLGGIRAVEVRGIHHRAIHRFRALKSGEKFCDWSKYREDSAEFSAEV
ncbi:N-terminal nucleophile aminohydrolases superfamily protein [Prunus dulcis]|uniref:N-terminal nucleophile aminohydrolases superfamily protein n=1 Tax=Prunus dulcis TaxID=3755 RepID=A0A4Y1QQF0_PRUDU|nr:N-terminal nucleophile aminohydrolases superfamily protein [Prunus dulcis]